MLAYFSRLVPHRHRPKPKSWVAETAQCGLRDTLPQQENTAPDEAPDNDVRIALTATGWEIVVS